MQRSLLALVALLLTASLRAADKPNLVLFLVDDMGWQDTSVPFHAERTPFNEHYRTPHMERLARQGVKFTQAYAAAVCSPTRTAILTGQSPVRHRVTNWTLYPDRDQSGRRGRLGAPRHWRTEGLQPWNVTLPRLLQRAGYFTIHAGKAHWGAIGTPGSDPVQLGFDVNVAGHSAGGPGHYHGEKNYGNEQKGAHTLPWGVPGLEKYHGTDTHLTEATTIEALAAVERAVKDEKKPFFLYLAHYAVHAPIQEHRPHVENYRGKTYPGTEIPIPDVEARYASMVEGMDASLGAVLERLESLGVAGETLVIFTSDNGGLSAHARGKTPRDTGKDTHNWPLREGKGSAYEGGTRVPFIASWARPEAESALQKTLTITAGRTCTTPIIYEDLFPTLLAWGGGMPPASHGLDGRDLTPLITASESPSAGERAFLFHYPHVWGPRGKGYQPHSAIRVGDWKAIYFYESRSWELYDLARDLGETEDRSEREAHRLRQLAHRMRAEFDRLGAQYPVGLETGEAEPPASPAASPNLLVDGTGPGWEPRSLADFINVNCAEDTWSETDGVIHATGRPVGVIRSKETIRNLEIVVEWRHLRPAGNSGVFLWASPESIARLEKGQGRLPHGIEVQVLDLGYAEHYEKRHEKPADWFTSHGDVFPTGPARMKPFPPVAPNGKRSFPSRNLTRDVGQWNHYYIRAINGEVRLWVNGEEVSGGTACQPADGYLCLESEGSPVEFRNLRVRVLP